MATANEKRVEIDTESVFERLIELQVQLEDAWSRRSFHQQEMDKAHKDAHEAREAIDAVYAEIGVFVANKVVERMGHPDD